MRIIEPYVEVERFDPTDFNLANYADVRWKE